MVLSETNLIICLEKRWCDFCTARNVRHFFLRHISCHPIGLFSIGSGQSLHIWRVAGVLLGIAIYTKIENTMDLWTAYANISNMPTRPKLRRSHTLDQLMPIVENKVNMIFHFNRRGTFHIAWHFSTKIVYISTHLPTGSEIKKKCHYRSVGEGDMVV